MEKGVGIMSIRETEEYKKMTSYLACACAEGFCEGEGASEEMQLAAWQYISDTGLWHNLQGFYGRAVNSLLEQGQIEAPV
jgi:hypothetical protein